jgi:HD superfamily phosphohydrolase YqeK/dephospho-CoA kinase
MYEFLISKRLINLLQVVETLYRDSNVKPYYHHTLRVAEYSYKIAKTEKINAELIVAASLIHDIGMIYDNSFTGHIIQTREKGPKILYSAGFSDKEIIKIISIAISHHPNNKSILIDNYEKILFDADNLDLVGAFGILRWFGKIPDSIQELKSSAELFISIIEEAYKTREYYFYTCYGRILGEKFVDECLDFCKKIKEFSNTFLHNNYDLHPKSITNQIYNNKNLMKPDKKIIVALCGFRCCGKSSIRKILSKYNINVYDTNSIEINDKDFNNLPISEIIKKYGKNEPYLYFINDDLRKYIDKSLQLVIIDSITTEKDLIFLKEHYPECIIKTIFIYAPYKIREERYIKCDVKTNMRNQLLKDHDNELIKLGILNLMYNSDYVIDNTHDFHFLESNIKNILFDITKQHIFDE